MTIDYDENQIELQKEGIHPTEKPWGKSRKTNAK